MTARLIKLEGHWPNWTGMLDNGKTVWCRIRYSAAYIGEGQSKEEAENHAELVHEGPAFYGVFDIGDALKLLSERYVVSIDYCERKDANFGG